MGMCPVPATLACVGVDVNFNSNSALELGRLIFDLGVSFANSDLVAHAGFPYSWIYFYFYYCCWLELVEDLGS